ncbi:hypothetical protein ARMSODRAFT_419593 [Armillaria solidipes]|uniref:Uncharacterized protein n=1 Tax=Armillaria solidipes TaxID=1076256 RepID=A0A2H3C2A8_9AGAR|nr:hypothetical protein ARMSODRAFT_419593 [Armillaria solidipes]
MSRSIILFPTLPSVQYGSAEIGWYSSKSQINLPLLIAQMTSLFHQFITSLSRIIWHHLEVRSEIHPFNISVTGITCI